MSETLYHVRYRDGFTIGAAGRDVNEAIERATSATGRLQADIDRIHEVESGRIVWDVHNPAEAAKATEAAGADPDPPVDERAE